jgi:hypothetical protein
MSKDPDSATDPSVTPKASHQLSSTAHIPSHPHRAQPPSEPRHPYKIRFTAEEWATILRNAGDCGTPPARYVREVALGHTPRARRPQANAELLRLLLRAGNNLNQLAYVANSRGQVNEAGILRVALDEVVAAARRVE